jgi:hypothetical protein
VIMKRRNFIRHILIIGRFDYMLHARTRSFGVRSRPSGNACIVEEAQRYQAAVWATQSTLKPRG